MTKPTFKTRCKVDGYHYVLTYLDTDWRLENGEAFGLYRGEVVIDGRTCIKFMDEWGLKFAALPSVVEMED